MKRPFYDRNGFKILLVAALCYGPTMIGAFRALKSNKNDVADWLPAQYEETTTFQWYRQHFANEQFILLSWDGCTLDDQRLRMMTAKLLPSPAATLPRQSAAGRAHEERPRYFKSCVTGKELLERLTGDQIKLGEEEALDRLKGSLIGPDGETTCVLLTLSDEGKQNLRKTVVFTRQIASKECAIPLDKLHMGGPAVDNVAIDEAGEQSLYRLAGLAAVIGLCISWWCLRNWKLIALVFFSGIYGAAASLAVVWWSPLALGHEPGWLSMNAILLTMPSLVYVATISGAIHLSNYYRDQLHEGVGLLEAPGKAIQHAALPLSLATLTTAVGLLTLCYSELVPIQLFGFYSAVGVVVSALLLFFFMPAVFQLMPLGELAPGHRRHDANKDDTPAFEGLVGPHRWRKVGEWIIHRQGPVTAGCLLLLGGCTYGMLHLETSVHLMRLFPRDAKILSDYQWLEAHLGELVPMEIVLKIDPQRCQLNFLERMELVERVQRKVEEIPDVGSSLSAVTFVPHLPRPEEYKNKKRRGGLLGTLSRVATGNREYEIARRQFDKYLAKHRQDFIDGDYLSEEDGHELWRVSARVGALKDVDYGLFLQRIREHVDSLLAQEGNEGVRPIYTGLVPLVYKAQRSLLQGLIYGFISDFILITIVMMIAVRDWSAGLILALPSIFPAAMVFGLMGWLGIVCDIGTVMAPSVALGVTVDDVVHFMIQYRNGLKLGMQRRQAVMLAYRTCATAMYQSWGVIGLGLSVFALSKFTPTQRFGYMMVTLLTSALIGNLVLLPALLAGPLGALFGRRLTKGRPQAAPAGVERPAAESARSVGPALRHHPPEHLGAERARRGL